MIGPLRWWRRRRAERQRALRFAQALPSFASLLAVLIGAGQHPRRALTKFVEVGPTGNMGELAHRLAPVSHALSLGADFTDVIAPLDHTSAQPARQNHGGVDLSLYRVLDLLRRGEVDGLDLATQLEFVVQDLRRERSIALDTAAQRLTVALLFPLVLCILPAFVLLAIVPLLLDVLSQLPA